VISVVALAAGLAAGCRNSPSVAAYVGDQRITEAEVDAAVAEAAAAAEGREGLQAPSRADVVMTYVLRQACSAKQAADRFPAAGQPVSPDQIAESERVPADSNYARDRAAAYTCLQAVPVGEGEAPTEDELRDLHQRAQAAGIMPQSYDEMREQLATDPGVRQALAVRTMLDEVIAAADVTVNPRYRPLEFHVSQVEGKPLIVAVVGGEGTSPVRDLL
jgi:hypothetical protein